MQNTPFRIAQFVMRNRILSLAVMIGITVFLGLGLRNVDLRTVFSDLLPADHPYVQTFKDHPNFGNPLTISIMVKRKEGTIYNVETLQKIWNMTREADLAPAVDHDQVVSISTEKARYAEAVPDGIDAQPIMGDHPPANQADVDEFRRRVEMSIGARAFLISADETSTIIQVTFIERLLDYGETFAYMQGLVERERDADHDVYMAGQPALTGWVYHYQHQMLWIFGITLAALVLSLVVYMRNVIGVVVPLTASAVTAVWGFGFVGWLNLPIEPLIMVVPLLHVARSFSHCAQFIERYCEILHHVKDRRKSAEIALGVMMVPGTLGIVTDAVGLCLIAVAPIPVMERLAIFCGFWAFMLVPANIFLSPLLLSWLPSPKNILKITGRDGDRGVHVKIRNGLRTLSTWTYGSRARFTTVAVGLVAVFCVWQTTQLKIGNPVEGSNLLFPKSEFNGAVAQINDHFPGLNTLEIVLEAKNPTNPSRVARQAHTIETMARIEYFLEKQPVPPVATLSFADYLPEANRLFAGGNPKWMPLDGDDASVGAAVGALMFGTSPKAFMHVTDFEQQNATVSLWYKDNTQETVDQAIAQAQAAVDFVGADHPEFRVRLATGTIALQQSVNEAVEHYHWIILGLLNLAMFVCCAYAYKSILAGVLLLIPVNLSNFFLSTVMVGMGIGLDVNSLPITAIGIGVGIDYGIYLLSRICEEYQGHKKYDAAILASVATTGKAIFFTASIMLLGILPWYFLSELKFLADMGLLLVMVMLINMVIALIVVPLLVWLIKPAFMKRDDLIVGEGVDLSAYITDDRELETLVAAQ
ncbi:RND transporter [Oleomonas cavernae]|uniref:RND transporter n=1 Tax=Oleomonas cavernae TaxID=2320859 RepID=A0A418WH62_9PROT|nr:MMPL family transporter [Oleomonas cavernae]RJF89377.1 RND transporter [Oleomonas cavernae]